MALPLFHAITGCDTLSHFLGCGKKTAGVSWQNTPGAKTIKKISNSTPNKSQTHRTKLYEVTSFLSTDCELSTETCPKNVYILGTRTH